MYKYMSLLTQQVRANATTIVGGVGSGGGGGGTVPTVSSINVGTNGNIVFTTPDNITNTGGLNWNTNAVGTTINQLAWLGVGDETGTQNTSLAIVQGPNPPPGQYFLQNIGVHGVFFSDQAGTGAGSYLTQDPNDAGGIYVSSLRVSSINGASPGGSAGPNPAFSTVTIASQAAGDQQNLVLSVDAGNNVLFGGGVQSVQMDALSTASATVSSITIQGFLAPVQQFGATTLDAGGSTIIGTDYKYSEPWYPLACYKGYYAKQLATLAVSTLDAGSFLITGEPSVEVIWQTLGN